MSDLLFVALNQLHAAPLPMQTFVEWLQIQTRDAKKVVIAIASVVILGLMVVRVVKSGFALSSLISTGLVAALAYWLIIGGGVDTISNLMDEQAKVK